MKNLTIRTLATLATATIVLGLGAGSQASAAPVKPASFAASYTDCSQSANLGARVCFDQSTAYGPIIFIYTSATALFGTYGVIGGGGIPASVFYEWESNWDGAHVILSGAPASTYSYSTPNNGAGTIQVGADVLDLLHWFSADSNYEFVVTT